MDVRVTATSGGRPLADLPLRLLCFFPADLPGPVAEVVRRAHPFVLDDGRPVPTGVDADPRRLLDGLGAPVPAELGAPAREFRFDATQLRDVRRAVDETLRGQGFPDSRAEDVTVAVNEVATNAVHHGTHTARLMLWTPEQDVVCEVHDGGRLADPLPGLVTTAYDLRLDYVLPSVDLEVVDAGVFAPTETEPLHTEVRRASDHRLVWVDLRIP